MREWKLNAKTGGDLASIAKTINPVIRGWINYYGKYHPSALRTTLNHINTFLVNLNGCKGIHHY